MTTPKGRRLARLTERLDLYRRRITLHGKLLMIMVLLVALSVLPVSILSYLQASNIVKKQAATLSLQQLHQMSATLDRSWEETRDLATFVVSDEAVQTFLSSRGDAPVEAFDQSFRTLSWFRTTSRGIRYLYVLKAGNRNGIYVGPSKSGSDLEAQLSQQIFANMKAADATIVRTDPVPDPIAKGQYTFLVLQPVFDIYHIQEQVGTLCIGMAEESFIQSNREANGPYEMTGFIVGNDGRILSHPDKTRIGDVDDGIGPLTGTQGARVEGDRLVVYEHVDSWDFWVVGTIPMDSLLKDSRVLVWTMMALMSGVLVLAILLALLFSRQLSRPFGELLARMDGVAAGDLESPIDLSRHGQDFEKVSSGFNEMTGRIRQLLAQIVEEQRQLQRIELLALHAQIKPHFLYNTLDSIRWLAAVNHQNDISTLVKALAGYYRICLSEGRDLIPLRAEIELVRHYLTIQRIRYGELFVVIEDIPEELMTLPLPKMTLQPLVENAIYHGLRRRGGDGHLTIRARRVPAWEPAVDGDVRIDVADDGPGLTPEARESLMRSIEGEGEQHSYGLKNVHKRLQLTFGAAYGLSFVETVAAGDKGRPPDVDMDGQLDGTANGQLDGTANGQLDGQENEKAEGLLKRDDMPGLTVTVRLPGEGAGTNA